MSRCLDCAVAHDGAAKLEVNTLKSNMLSICEADVVRAAQARSQAVCAHATCELVEAPELVGFALGMHVEICNGRVVRSMLAEDLGSIRELALKCLTKDRVKRLVLARANVQTAQREGNNLLKSL